MNSVFSLHQSTANKTHAYQDVRVYRTPETKKNNNINSDIQP